ncbi:MAG TPA: hypothetical protein ENK17_03050, partial [Anaerolineae bacterium]|nr:hypothetical protein [Anaerolineae bacterium]
YTVHIVAENFQAGGLLDGYVSSIGHGDDETTDDDGDENGIDQPDLATTGISSTLYVLAPNTEITGENQVNYTGYLDDDNVNFTADFGFVQLVALGNLVWFDTGAGGGTADNGIRDGTEPGAAGVEVQLFRPGDATPLLTTTTDASGYYTFDLLIPGTYYVHIPASEFQAGGPLNGYVSSLGHGTDEATDDDGDENGIDQPALATTGISSTLYILQPDSEPITDDQTSYAGYLDDDNVNFTADFGFVEGVALGNLVWFDTGAGTAYDNGVFDAGETPAANVTVQLFRQGGATPLLTTTTDAQGRYYFDNLNPGTYYVRIPGSQFDTGGPLEGYVSSADAGTSEDTDHDSDENGIDEHALVANGIRSMDYDLQPNAEVTGEDATHYTGYLDDDNANFTADFGFVEGVALGNLVWLDNGAGGGTPNDGIQNGAEPGVAGVTVTLYISGQATPLMTTTTAANGWYYFDNLNPGTYTVRIPAVNFQAGGVLAGYLSSTGNGGDETTDHTGDENGIDSSTPEVTGIGSTAYALTPGGEVTGEDDTAYTGHISDDSNNFTADFGFYAPGDLVAIGNLIWFDT